MQPIGTGRKLLYTVILFSLVLLMCEGIVRVRAMVRYGTFSVSVRDPMLTYDTEADLFVPVPGYELKGDRLHIRINSLGFRGDEFSARKPAGTLRIAVLGASTTFNAEVSSNGATWPHRLQEKLRAAYPGQPIEVVNAAIGGYVAADNLKSLRHRVLPLDPDLVIYYEANNEIVRDTRELAIERGLTSSGVTSPLVATLASYSLLFDLAHKNLSMLVRARLPAPGLLDEVPADLPNRFLGVLDEMRGELERRDVPFVLSTFIVKYRRDQERQTQIANADVAFYYMPWMSIDGMLDAMDRYNDAIVRFGRSRGLTVVDDRHVIPPDADHFTDCMHLGDKGAEVMAERFFHHLRTEGLIDRLLAKVGATPIAAVRH